MKLLYSIISTVFFVGRLPFSPGTFGSLAGLLLIAPVIFIESFPLFVSILFTALISACILGFVFIPKYLAGKTDDLQEIVIDEVAGLYLTVLLAVFLCKMFKIDYNITVMLLSSFALFRIFDITKPSIIGYYDKTLKGAVGIMVDDLLAGIFAGFTLFFIALIFKIFK